jgi:hypothetical protein
MAVIVCLPHRAKAGIGRGQMRLLLSSRQISSVVPCSTLSTPDDKENVISFSPLGTASRRELGAGRYGATGESPIKGLQEYKSAIESDDDYRHRMRVNLLSAVAVIMLIVSGSWVMDTLVESAREGQTWKQLHGVHATP